MRYSARTTVYRNARNLAGSAIDSARGHLRLEQCRALLRELDPDKPPTAAHAREFQWQYRALRERVHLYSERLAAVGDPGGSCDYNLRKAETAIELSLRYFCDVLAPSRKPDDDGGVGGDA